MDLQIFSFTRRYIVAKYMTIRTVLYKALSQAIYTREIKSVDPILHGVTEPFCCCVPLHD